MPGLSISLPMRKVFAWAAQKEFKANDTRFRRSVRVIDEEGSVFQIENAFLLEVDDEWLVCFSEHQGIFVWAKEGVVSSAQYQRIYEVDKETIGE